MQKIDNVQKCWHGVLCQDEAMPVFERPYLIRNSTQPIPWPNIWGLLLRTFIILQGPLENPKYLAQCNERHRYGLEEMGMASKEVPIEKNSHFHEDANTLNVTKI